MYNKYTYLSEDVDLFESFSVISRIIILIFWFVESLKVTNYCSIIVKVIFFFTYF